MCGEREKDWRKIATRRLLRLTARGWPADQCLWWADRRPLCPLFVLPPVWPAAEPPGGRYLIGSRAWELQTISIPKEAAAFCVFALEQSAACKWAQTVCSRLFVADCVCAFTAAWQRGRAEKWTRLVQLLGTLLRDCGRPLEAPSGSPWESLCAEDSLRWARAHCAQCGLFWPPIRLVQSLLLRRAGRLDRACKRLSHNDKLEFDFSPAQKWPFIHTHSTCCLRAPVILLMQTNDTERERKSRAQTPLLCQTPTAIQSPQRRPSGPNFRA